MVFRYGGQQTKAGNPDKEDPDIPTQRKKSTDIITLSSFNIAESPLVLQPSFWKEDYSNTLCISENELISRPGEKKLEHVTAPDAATKVTHGE